MCGIKGSRCGALGEKALVKGGGKGKVVGQVAGRQAGARQQVGEGSGWWGQG